MMAAHFNITMSQIKIDWTRLGTSLLATGISSFLVYFMMKSLYKQLDPSYEKSEKAMVKVALLLQTQDCCPLIVPWLDIG
jgi:hypothetical protein